MLVNFVTRNCCSVFTGLEDYFMNSHQSILISTEQTGLIFVNDILFYAVTKKF